MKNTHEMLKDEIDLLVNISQEMSSLISVCDEKRSEILRYCIDQHRRSSEQPLNSILDYENRMLPIMNMTLEIQDKVQEYCRNVNKRTGIYHERKIDAIKRQYAKPLDDHDA